MFLKKSFEGVVDKRNDEKFPGYVVYSVIELKLYLSMQISSIDFYISLVRTPGKLGFDLGVICQTWKESIKLAA